MGWLQGDQERPENHLELSLENNKIIVDCIREVPNYVMNGQALIINNKLMFINSYEKDWGQQIRSPQRQDHLENLVYLDSIKTIENNFKFQYLTIVPYLLAPTGTKGNFVVLLTGNNNTVQTLKSLKKRIKYIRPDLTQLLLHHDNARPYRSHVTIEAIESLRFQVIPYTSCRLQLLKEYLKSDSEIKSVQTSRRFQYIGRTEFRSKMERLNCIVLNTTTVHHNTFRTIKVKLFQLYFKYNSKQE
ncbi:hypothetical protein AGLY_010350 [Aphis glycines]|uniref:Uncharacterized protein n=1 Tax=Aphis glycines TaxID=307491 RepID=A0A6G0TGL9_APHGL|nr:hypothetical protein AGLY_010350 [Aphis glycines]